MTHHDASRRSPAEKALLALMIAAYGVWAGQACIAANGWADDPFEDSRRLYGEATLGLEAGADAPLLSELGIEEEPAILTLYAGCGTEEIAALRLVSEAFELRVVAALTECPDARRSGVRGLIEATVQLIGDPLADRLLSAYQVGYDVASIGITFLIGADGRIALRRFGSPAWLFDDDCAVVAALVNGEDVSEVALPQHVLSQGEQAPMPPFHPVDDVGEEIQLDDGTPRLIYSGLDPGTPLGAIIAADLDALRSQFPNVEFLWHRPLVGADQAGATWEFYRAAGLASLYPDLFEVPFDEYMSAHLDAGSAILDRKISECQSYLDSGWRLALDVGEQLGTFWCLLTQEPFVLILDGSGAIALPYTAYFSAWSDQGWSVHPGAQDALRQILLDVTRR
jgi:hypothetical protein